jgi:hypothetical protein
LLAPVTGNIRAMARRYAVKLFLPHLHAEMLGASS